MNKAGLGFIGFTKQLLSSTSNWLLNPWLHFCAQGYPKDFGGENEITIWDAASMVYISACGMSLGTPL